MSMEVQAVNNTSLLNNSILSPTVTIPTTKPSAVAVTSTPKSTISQKTSKTLPKQLGQTGAAATVKFNNSITSHSRSSSPASSNSEIEKELQEINDLGITLNLQNFDCKSNGSLSGSSTTSQTMVVCGTSINDGSLSTSTGGTSLINGSAKDVVGQLKKRITSSRTSARKALRIKFYRNGDRFYPGITIPVSNERYRSFESLFEHLTRLLEENVKIPGAVRTIYTMCGKKISSLEEFEDGQCYVCSCNSETFKKIEYNTTSQPLANLTLSNRSNNRLTKPYRPSSPLKNGSIGSGSGSSNTALGNGGGGGVGGTNGGSPQLVQLNVVYPRIVTLIRNGTKPRRIMRLLLNKRNSPTFDHVLTAITQVVKLDTGYVRKVFTLSGTPVQQLSDFFSLDDDVFFAYGTERVNNADDFKLESDEQRAIQAKRKNLRTAADSSTCKGPKPKMPIKSKNIQSTQYEQNNSAQLEEDDALSAINDCGIDASDLPSSIRERYCLGQIVGDGNFAVVLRVKDRQTATPYALKIIDKSKCKGKEHYIDAEVRVMKKLQHPHIISLYMDVDQTAYMYLVLEYVRGGDLFDAITRATRFSEEQSRVMIRHLASAMAYLHSMGIVHRDIKPENLLVDIDERGNVNELKLADFGLACEVTEPLYAVCGTPTYVAPEILLETGYDVKIDVWAAGIILYILLCGFPPFVSPDNEQEPLFEAIMKGVYDFPEPYWSDIGDDVRDLIANMLQSDPDVRFTSEDILDHYWTMDVRGDDCNDFSS